MIDYREEYFFWLCSIVGADDPDPSYIKLMRALHRFDFYTIVDNDINRGEDGKRLRDDFMHLYDMASCPEIEGPCTVLEMLIGLAIRIDEDIMWEEGENRTSIWFWTMIENLGLDVLDDEAFEDCDAYETVENVLCVFLSRSYSKDGVGGLFPLKNPAKDQRDVEIWYQMNAYFVENYLDTL